MSIFKGCGTAIVTPFNDFGVDFDSLKNQLDIQIKNNIDAIIVCGTTGEASTMTEKEKIETIDFTVKHVNGRIPVIAGTGSNCTKTAIENSIKASELGVNGVLVVTPYYNKSNTLGLTNHFKEISNNIKDTPVILYNVPSRTGVNIPLEVYDSLKKSENIVAIKEASGDLNYLGKIFHKHRDRYDIYTGCDSDIFSSMALGSVGVISVISNVIPELTQKICSLFFNGEYAKSRDLQYELLPLIESIFIEVNPIPVKTAMNLMGLNAGNLRLPLYDLSDNSLNILKNTLKDYKLI